MKSIRLQSVDLSSLKDHFQFIRIRLNNSVDIIDEFDGPENFYIKLDTIHNTAVPINDNEDISLLEQYTDATYAGIYESYIEWGSFEGMFSISSENDEWNLDFHGSSLEDEYGDISEEEKNAVIELLNPKAIFLIAEEVLSHCNIAS
jgi:hypothetical protein